MIQPTHVIIGASLAGATAAVTLRQQGVKGRVVLIGAEPEPPYERPPLSKAYLRGETALGEVRPSAFYAEHGIETMFGARVTRIDSDAKTVELHSNRISFDALLIATGVRNRSISIPGSDLDGVHSVRTVRDADRIRAEMAPGRRAVVVGMGFIGSEVAASLRHAVDGSGVRVENGVVVDEYCTTNISGVYAAGDVANHYHPVFDRQIRVEHWHNAIKQGAAAARNMLGQRVAYNEVHWFWSDQYDVNPQYAGYHTSAEQIVVRGALASDSFLVSAT